MDGTRARRTRDKARQAWYARHRQRRFARFLGFDDRGQDPASRRRPAPGAINLALGIANSYLLLLDLPDLVSNPLMSPKAVAMRAQCE